MLINAWNYGNILARSGQILIGQGSMNPVASFLTSSAHTLSYAFGPGSINIDLNTGSLFFNPLQIGNGGTGRTILTTYGVLIGEGSNNVNVTAAGANGQVLIASSTGDPKFSTITSNGGTVTFTFGYNSLNIEAITSSSALLPITFVSGTTSFSYSVTASDYFLSVSTDYVRTIILPNTTATGRVIVVKDRTGNAQSNPINVQAVSGTVTVDNSSLYQINVSYASIQLLFDGADYQVF